MPRKSRSLTHLGQTSTWAAAVRARESERTDRLFSDPWADALAGSTGEAWVTGRTPESLAPMTIRTRYFDDFLVRTSQLVPGIQLVMLASGLDTRAYRLDWPEGTCIFELDQPEILESKRKVLTSSGKQPSCDWKTIAVNLVQSWSQALLDAGFSPGLPSCWLMEGFLFYINNQDIHQILNTINQLSARGSWMGFDIVNGLVLTSPYTKAWVEMQANAGAPWIGCLDDPEELLGNLGWRVTLSQAGAEDANYGRWPLPVYPVKMPNMPHHWFVTAEKVE